MKENFMAEYIWVTAFNTNNESKDIQNPILVLLGFMQIESANFP